MSKGLNERHLAELVEGSGITPEIIEGRGYRTITSQASLRRWGFTSGQGGEGPWLWIPLYAPDSDFKTPSGYQIKPTTPRVDPTGRTMKYEFPKGSASVMDVHPSVADRLADPSEPLYVTEGTKKADAAVSHGLVALSVPGVWGWKAGQLPHEAWNVIPLKDREVYLAFDSDAVTKTGVWDALEAFLRFLRKRGANAKAIILPILHEGTKTGLDDFLLDQPVEALRAYGVDELPPRPEQDSERGGLVYRLADGSDLRLSNFDARIRADIVKDDGLDQHREVELEATLGEVTANFTLPVDQFESMSWHIDHLGSDAILYAGRDIPQKAREVIQSLSFGKPERHVFTHTGWRKLRLRTNAKPEWVYLTPTGAVGARGLAEHVVVDLGGTMNGIALPSPPSKDDAVQAVRDSLLLIDEEMGVMPYQMYFALWRAVMGEVPFGYWLYGTTGSGKSELAALVQQHWGRELTPDRFMANWMSTENFINEIAFKAKDMILVVDDFRPTGARSHILRLNQSADRLFRSQGNTAGRGRMRRDLTLAVGHPVRSMILSTAEDLPEGESLLARLIAEELPMEPERFDRLDIHQRNAVMGQYELAMSAFLQWAAPRYDALQNFIEKGVLEHRKQFLGKHRRTQEAGAHLMVGAHVFLQFAEEIGAISPTERAAYLDTLAMNIRTEAQVQSTIQWYENPVRRARELLLYGIQSGQYKIDGYGEQNYNAETVGWYREEPDGREVFLLYSTAFRKALVHLAREADVEWHISPHRLGQALQEADWLIQQESQGTTQVAKVDGKTYRVYRVPVSFIEDIEEGEITFEIDTPEEAF